MQFHTKLVYIMVVEAIDYTQIKELDLMVRVAAMYYEQDLTQEVIASILSLSKSKISRLVKQAHDLGLVRISVLNPLRGIETMEWELCERLGLKAVKIAPCDSREEILPRIAQKASDHFIDILQPHDIVGVSWGTTMYRLALCTPELRMPTVQLVQLKGGVSGGVGDSYFFKVADVLSTKLHCPMYYLPIPVVVENEAIKNTFLAEPNIQKAVELALRADIVLTSIGYPSHDSVITRCGYLTGEQLDRMREDGAAGDILSRFFRMDGSIYSDELNRRTTSFELDHLRGKKHTVGIAGGSNRIGGILGAVNGGYINTLVTDSITAAQMLEMDLESLIRDSGKDASLSSE